MAETTQMPIFKWRNFFLIRAKYLNHLSLEVFFKLSQNKDIEFYFTFFLLSCILKLILFKQLLYITKRYNFNVEINISFEVIFIILFNYEFPSYAFYLLYFSYYLTLHKLLRLLMFKFFRICIKLSPLAFLFLSK